MKIRSYRFSQNSNYKIWIIAIFLMITAAAMMSVFSGYSKEISIFMTIFISRFLKEIMPKKKYTKRQNFCWGFGIIIACIIAFMFILYAEKYAPYLVNMEITCWYEFAILIALMIVSFFSVVLIGYGLAYLISAPFVRGSQNY